MSPVDSMHFPMTPVSGLVFALGASAQGGSLWTQLPIIPVALIVGIFYFLILLPARRKEQKVQQFLQGLKVGDRIITTGGLYGNITRVGETSVQLQIADKLRVEVAKAAIGGYQGQSPVVEAASE